MGYSSLTGEVDVEMRPNGPTIAAILAAGIGSFALGLVVLLNETGIWSAPAVYGPAGGVSGRVSAALLVWLLAWVGLHFAWRTRRFSGTALYVVAIGLVVLGIIATFPPLWPLLG